jgi:3-oxoacyl-[acyl-carrier protein] reductase
MIQIKGKNALITGSSRGVGQQIAQGLAKLGCNIIVHGRTQDSCEKTVNLLKQYHVKVYSVYGELSGQSSVDQVINQVRDLKIRVDILYNNAAIMTPRHEEYWKHSWDEWMDTFKVNVFAMYSLCAAFIPEMTENGFGRVINLTSGIKDQPELAPYGASKWAVNKLTDDIAVKLINTGVRINTLDPGWLRTDLGGPNADNPVEATLPGSLAPALVEDDGPNGQFFSAIDHKLSMDEVNSLMKWAIMVCIYILMVFAFPINPIYAQSGDIELNMSDPALWTVDIVHLGSKQVDISGNPKENAAVLRPEWSINDTSSPDVSSRNIENGRLHLYQHIKMSDCTQSEVEFEIRMPKEYVDEGRMEFVFSLQAGAEGDYLFNGHTFKMSDFRNDGGTYKKIIVVPADYNENPEKLRKIERVNIIFERRGSVVSAPISIRNLKIKLNKDKIVPPKEDIKVKNPHTYYKFTYDTQSAIDLLQVRISPESMDITRKLSQDGKGMALIPQWGAGQIPIGHTGDVTIVQQLGAPHNFEPFKVEYVFNIPKAYFDEGDMQIVPFVQAGEQGFFVWSGVPRSLALYAGKGDEDIVITLSTEDFLVNKQKKKNLIEIVGFKLERHGSTLTAPIILKSITVKLE